MVKSDHAETLGDFKSLVMELEFAVRSVFFIMLGLWTPLESLRDPMAWLTAAGILGVLLALRYVLLKLLNMPVAKLVWLAPRGLITVLLLLTAMDRIDLGASFRMPGGGDADGVSSAVACWSPCWPGHRKSDEGGQSRQIAR